MSENCKGCNRPMIAMRWNSNADVLTCNNSSCGFFRQPISIPIGSTTLAEDLSKVYVGRKRHPWRAIHATATFGEKLQELRDEISTQT